MSHLIQIYAVCLLFFEYSIRYSVDLTFLEKQPEFANSVDIDEVAHSEPPHLDLHCLPSTL